MGEQRAMRIGEVATRTELSLRSLRHWEEIGVIRPSARSEGGYRLYTPDDVERILVIRRMKPLGFSLEEMRAVMADIELLHGGEPPSGPDHRGTGADEARDRLRSGAAEAAERRTALERQLGMADEFLSLLEEEIGRSRDDDGPAT